MISSLILAAVSTMTPGSALDFTMLDIDGNEVELKKFKSRVVMMVNVASKCGNTPQYEGLQAIYKHFGPRGFVVLGFPANEFGKQEPGSNEEIKDFCTSNYGVTFPMFAKVVVKGEGICPLYSYLTSKETNPKFGGEIRWNFTKFLLDKKGNVVARFEPNVQPTDPAVLDAIEKALGPIID